MAFNINFITLNVGMSASLAGLSDLAESEDLDVLFLQEVNLGKNQIESILRGYKAAVNIDENNPSRPGTALVWREDIVVTDVCSVVPCRAQVASIGDYKLMNIYAGLIKNMKEQFSSVRICFACFFRIYLVIGFWVEILTLCWSLLMLREE